MLTTSLSSGTFHHTVFDPTVKRTYVVFSSVDIEPGKFMFWKMMDALPGSKVFVNDELNGWYVHGIPGLGDTVAGAAQALRHLIQATGPEETIFIGPSMGAFGAMFYGALLKDSLAPASVRCLSFGGEFILYGRETRSGALSKKPRNPDYADIRSLLGDSALDVTHVYGDSDIVDNAQADSIHGLKNVKSLPIRNAPHAVSTHLGQRGLLTRLLSSYVAGAEMIPLSTTRSGLTSGFGSRLQRGHFALIDGEYDLAITCLTEAVSLCPENAMAHHKLGIALLQCGRLDEALAEQEHATDMDPNMALAYYQRAALLMKLNRKKDARIAFLQCAQLMPGHIKANLSMAYFARNDQDWQQAETFLRNVLAAQPDNVEARSMMKQVLEKTLEERTTLLSSLSTSEAKSETNSMVGPDNDESLRT